MQRMTSMDHFNDAGASHIAKSSLQKSAIAFCHNLSESDWLREIKCFCQASKMVSGFSCLELCHFVLQFVVALSWARILLWTWWLMQRDRPSRLPWTAPMPAAMLISHTPIPSLQQFGDMPTWIAASRRVPYRYWKSHWPAWQFDMHTKREMVCTGLP